MQGTILALFGAALASGLAELLLPSEEEGTSKVFRFLISLIVLLLILTPFLDFLQKNEGIFTGEISIEEKEEAEFEQIFSDTVGAQSKVELEKGLYALLLREYGIAPENATLWVRFDANGALASVSIYLSGAGLLQDPVTLEKALTEKLGCRVEVR